MKLLFQTDHKPEALTAQLQLQAKGIPAFIGSERSGQVIGGALSTTYALWVELDHQHEDALAVLQNPEHEVAHPVSIEDYDAFQEAWQRRFDERMRQLGRWSIYAVLLLALWGVAHLLVDAVMGS